MAGVCVVRGLKVRPDGGGGGGRRRRCVMWRDEACGSHSCIIWSVVFVW